MKIIAKLFTAPPLVATLLACSAAIAQAEPAVSSSRPDEGHTARIIHNLDARMDKVKTKFKYHAEKTADKIGATLEKLTE